MKSRNKTTDDVELPSYCNPEDDTRYRNCHFIPNSSVNTIPPSKCHVETSRSKSELFVYFVPSQNNNGTSNVSAALTSAFLFFFLRRPPPSVSSRSRARLISALRKTQHLLPFLPRIAAPMKVLCFASDKNDR